MKYDIEELKKKLNALSSTKKSTGDKAKINWWKAVPGKHEVRFLPLYNEDGSLHKQPFFEVVYYDNKDLAERRLVQPAQFGLPDPIKEAALSIAHDKSKEGWLVRKKLQAKERYYAPIIVRGEEEKGVQIWEISAKICKDVFALLVSDDWADEDMFSVDKGYDFNIDVSPTDKTFNGYVVNEIKILPKRKDSKLHAKKEQVDAWLKAVPNFEAFFKSQVKTQDELVAIVTNFFQLQMGEEVGETSTEGTSRGVADNAKVASEVNDAFADLENS